MANDDLLSVTFLLSCADPERLGDARRVLSLCEGVGSVDIAGADDGHSRLTLTYDPAATSPEQAIGLLARLGCQVMEEQEPLALGTGGVDLATEVDLFGHPVDVSRQHILLP